MAAVCAAGLRHYRVGNSMDAWMPDLATPGPYRSYVVVGFPSDRVDASAIASRLRALPATAFCIDPLMLRATGWLTGVTADDFVVGKDGAYSGVFCFRDASATDRQLIDQVERAISGIAPRDVFALGGPAAFQCAMDYWSQDRLGLILACILLLGGLMLWLVTGSIRIAAIAMAAITLSQIIFLGAISWLRIPVDMALALVPPMMMGLGFSYAAHRALRRQSFMVLVVCAIAAAVGIASFATADLMPVRHFALAGVPGLVLVWLATITLVQPDRVARRRRIAWMRIPRRICIGVALRYRRPIITAASVVMLLGVGLAPLLHIQADPLTFFPATSQIARDFETLDHRLTGMLPSQIVVHGDADPRPLLTRATGMRKVIDITAWVGGRDHTYLCLADDNTVDALAAQLPAWQSWAHSQNATLQWHGVAPQIHRSGASVRRIALESLPSMAILIALVIALLFRRLRTALVGVWICLLPVAGLIIAAVVARWPLGPVTLMIGSITVGVAVDDTLHLLTASRRHRSIRRGFIECWKPCVGSSLAAAACFSLFLLSPFGPTSQFGLLMALSTCFAMLANQLVLPACTSPCS